MIKHHLTPRFILQQYDVGRENGRFTAAALFVDISGFTAVTETLMQQGKVGAEMLADVMQAIFTPLIDAVYQRGGFINGFAGDAFTAIFPGRGVRAKARAVDAAWAMRAALAEFETFDTPLGTFAFSGRVGVAAGSVNWGIVGNDQRRTAYFRGVAVDACAEAEHQATNGEIILTQQVAVALTGYLTVSSRGDHARLDAITQPLPLSKPPRFDQDGGKLETAVAFHPESLLNMTAKGEFRQVITAFVNVKGNPPPAKLDQFMQRCFLLLAQYDGYLCRLDFGDKGCNLLLFWGAPTSHENDIERTLNFLLALQTAVSLPFRAGVTFRQAFAGFCGSPLREEYTCYGLSINQAARQMLKAGWGEIWLDQEVAKRAEQFDTPLIDTFQFKGFAQPQPIFRLAGRTEQRDPFYQGGFVGREAEVAQLTASLRPLTHNHFGDITLISGEAGIGKSRLVHHLLSSSPYAQIVCQTDEILRRQLNPFRYALRRAFEQTQANTDAQNKAAFTQKLSALIAAAPTAPLRDELQRTHTFLGALVDLHWEGSLYSQLTPELRLENTLTALKAWVRAEAAIRPFILLIEDVQWLDDTSKQFLQQLPFGMDGYPVAIWLTSREAASVAIFGEETAVTHISLGGISKASVTQMIQNQLGAQPSPALVQLLTERAEGNPFYLEQLLLYLQEQELLGRTEQLTQTEAQELLPQDVQTVLVARLDRLSHEVRQVVQTAAVLGREFEVRVLSHMLRQRQNLSEQIEEAEKAAIWARLNELTYLFHHALLRDAAYAMQLETQLQALHRTAAQSLETMYAENLNVYAEELGYHWEAAGDVKTAVFHWQQAAQNSQQTYQNEKAIAQLDKLLTHLELFTKRELIETLMEKATISFKLLGNYDDAEEALTQAIALAETENDPHLLGKTVGLLGQMWVEHGEYDRAQQQLQRSRDILEQEPSSAALALAYRELGNASEGFGDYEEAARLYAKGKAVSETIDDTWGVAQANLNLGLMRWNSGAYDEAETLYRQALAGFEATNDLYSQCKVYNNLGSVAWGREEMETAVTQYTRAYEKGKECGSYLVQSITLGNLGTIANHKEEYEKSNEYQLESLRISEEVNELYGIAFTKCSLANNYNGLGDIATSKRMLHEAIQLAIKIKADALILECFITAAAHFRTADPATAYKILAYTKAHPACYAEMAHRIESEEKKIVGLSEADKQRVDSSLETVSMEDIQSLVFNIESLIE